MALQCITHALVLPCNAFAMHCRCIRVELQCLCSAVQMQKMFRCDGCAMHCRRIRVALRKRQGLLWRHWGSLARGVFWERRGVLGADLEHFHLFCLVLGR